MYGCLCHKFRVSQIVVFACVCVCVCVYVFFFSSVNKIVRLCHSIDELFVRTDNARGHTQFSVNDELLPPHPRLLDQQILTLPLAKKCCDLLVVDFERKFSSYTMLPRKGNAPFAKAFYVSRDVFNPAFEVCLNNFLNFVKDNATMCNMASKPGVSGLYFEAGYGFMAGSQNTSICVDNKKSNLPFLRSQKITSEIKKIAQLLEAHVIRKFRDCFGKAFPNNEFILASLGLINKTQRSVMQALSFPADDDNVFPLPGRAYRLSGNIESVYPHCHNDDGGSTIHRDDDDATSSHPVSPIIYVGDQEESLVGYNLSVFEGRDGGRGMVIPTVVANMVTVVFLNSRSPHGSVHKIGDSSNKLGLRIVPYVTKNATSFAQLFRENQLLQETIMHQWKSSIQRLIDRAEGYNGERHYACYVKVNKKLK